MVTTCINFNAPTYYEYFKGYIKQNFYFKKKNSLFFIYMKFILCS